MSKQNYLNRRQFLKTSMAGTAGAVLLPTILPSSVFGADAPSKKIHIAHIGCGRIANEMDIPGIIKHDVARYVAVCDLDSKRVTKAKERIEKHYAAKQGSDKAMTIKTFGDYREMLKEPDIDAVAISTPDHWHAEPLLAAGLAGKDVYVQKPFAMTIAEGRQVSNLLRTKKIAFQIGSQQRSDSPWPQFRRACELVRNGRIGKIHTVQIGLPSDPAGGKTNEQSVPPNLNYDMWLGSTPNAPYYEDRVHPQEGFGRPGWLRIEAYSLGMITGWGSHHVDIGHWGMNTEMTGPIEAVGHAEFPKAGLWNVHGPHHIELKYANGATMIFDEKFPNGVKFEGDGGWIFVTRSSGVTASDPMSGSSKFFTASDPKILKSEIGPNEIHLHSSKDHHLDWLQSIQTRQPSSTNPEQAHRSTSACDIAWIAMKMQGKTLHWDPDKEEFSGNDEANKMRSRPQRDGYGTNCVLKKA
jgi:myo-inositol 2-dehydrogenase/D-chiro-inositol 1-dehydrogenase